MHVFGLWEEGGGLPVCLLFVSETHRRVFNTLYEFDFSGMFS